jgi:hypothetical protein
MPDLMRETPEEMDVRLSAEEMADRLPWVMTGVRVALETKDATGDGRRWIKRLQYIARRAEHLCQQWERERQASKTS